VLVFFFFFPFGLFSSHSSLSARKEGRCQGARCGHQGLSVNIGSFGLLFLLIACFFSHQSDAPKASKDNSKGADKKKSKKVKKVTAKPLILDYKRVNTNKAKKIKEQQTKQRALAVARVISQASLSLFSRSQFYIFFCFWFSFFSFFFACDCCLLLQIGTT
jgi:hypothetical protein